MCGLILSVEIHLGLLNVLIAPVSALTSRTANFPRKTHLLPMLRQVQFETYSLVSSPRSLSVTWVCAMSCSNSFQHFVETHHNSDFAWKKSVFWYNFTKPTFRCCPRSALSALPSWLAQLFLISVSTTRYLQHGTGPTVLLSAPKPRCTRC